MSSRLQQNQQAFETIYSIFQRKKNANRSASNRTQQQFQWIQENIYLRNRQKQLEIQIGELCDLANICRNDYESVANEYDDDDECNGEHMIRELTLEIDQDMKSIYQEIINQTTTTTTTTTTTMQNWDLHKECCCIRNLEADFDKRQKELEHYYEMKWDKSLDRYEKYCANLQISIHCKTGSWDQSTHERFLSIYSRAFREQNPKQNLLVQLAQLIPSKSKSNIKQHLDWFERYRAYQAAKKDNRNALRRDLEALQDELNAACKQACSKCELERASSRQRQLLDQKSAYLHNRLVDLRTEWDQRIREAEQQQLEQQWIEGQIQHKERMKWRKHQEMNHKLIEQFKKEKAEQAAIEHEILRQIDEHQKQTQLVLQAINQERVKYRQKCLEQRQAQRQAMIEEGLRQVEKRRRRLELIKKLVQIHAERDPERVLQKTISTKCRHDALLMKSGDAAPFKQVHGYNIDQLVADRRFAVALALSESGLYNTDYGHWLMISGEYNSI